MIAKIDETGKVWCLLHDQIPENAVPLTTGNLDGGQTCHECGEVIAEGFGEVYPRA